MWCATGTTDPNYIQQMLAVVISALLLLMVYFVVRNAMRARNNNIGAWLNNSDHFLHPYHQKSKLLAILYCGVIFGGSYVSKEGFPNFWDWKSYSFPIFLLLIGVLLSLNAAIKRCWMPRGSNVVGYSLGITLIIVFRESCLNIGNVSFIATGAISALLLDLLSKHERQFYKIRHGQI